MGKASGHDFGGQRKSPIDIEPLDPGLLRQLVSRVEELLPLPTVVNEILKVINDPYASLDRLSRVILADQALTAKILKIINSAFYCMPMRVTTVSQAVPLLGVEKIKNLAMAISLSEGISRWSGLPGLSRESLWLHGQASAVATKLLAEEIGYPVSEEAMIAGMLHDVAKALWTELFPERFTLALQEIREGRMTPQDAETAFLTIPHSTVGSWLLRQWCMPEVLQQAVAKHHRPPSAFPPKRGKAHTLPLCVGLANILAKLLNLGDSGNLRLHDFSLEHLEALHLEPAALIRIIQQLPAAVQEFIDQLDLKGFDNSSLPSQWLHLKKRLAEVELILISPNGAQEYPGPVGWLCRALTEHLQILTGDEFAAWAPTSGRQIALLEILPPAAPPEWISSPSGVSIPLVVIHHDSPPPGAAFLPKVAGIFHLGPEIRLSELAAAISGKGC